ncbi:MAG: D-sedoheptulose-7-phosphate isomerase [Armatimonadota bacterium]
MTLKTITLQHLDTLLTRYPALTGLREHVGHATELICESCRSGGKLLVCGNGGSAADSEHIVGELMKSFVLPRKLRRQDVDALRATGVDGWEGLADKLQRGVPAVSLVGHAALASAISNDVDPSMIYAQQVYVLGRPGDVLLGLSTSGNSRNVVKAIKVAKAFGLKTIGFTGNRQSEMEMICDITIKAPCEETYQVQEYHQPIYHAICLMVEEEMFGLHD